MRTLYKTITIYSSLTSLFMYTGILLSVVGSIAVVLSGTEHSIPAGILLFFGGIIQSVMLGVSGEIAAAISETARNTRNIRTYDKISE